MKSNELARRAAAEFLGTGLLLASIVGSGILAERLTNGNVGLALLTVALAAGAVLVPLILTFGPVSGAHFNPIVTLSDALGGGLPWRVVPVYLSAQVLGALAGLVATHAMYDLPLLVASSHARAGVGQWLSELVATFGLMAVILGCSRQRSEATPYAVASYVVGAVLFTSSTCFVNPALTLARGFTDTLTGIRPVDAPAFILAELLGGAAAVLLFAWLVPQRAAGKSDVVVPHPVARRLAVPRR